MPSRFTVLLDRLTHRLERLSHDADGGAHAAEVRELLKLTREIGGSVPEERRLFRRLAEGVPDGLFRMRLDDGRFEYVNPALEAMTGYLRKEFCGQEHIHRLVVHPRWLSYVEDALEGLRAGRNEGEYEIAVLTRAREERRLLLRTALVRKDGRPTHVEGVARDVTAIRHGQSVLQRHRFMTDSTRDPMSLIGRDYLYKAANRAFVNAVEEVCRTPLNRHVAEVWGERVFTRIIRPALDECFQGREVNYEAWFAFPGRTEGYYEVTYTPYREDGLGVTHAVVVTRDLTRRKLAEQSTRRADARFRQVVESISDVILTLDDRRRLTYVSPAVERLLGLDAAAVQHRDLEELVHAEDRQGVQEDLAALPEAGETVTECRVLARDGTPIWVRLALRALKEQGRYMGAAGRMTNISQRKSAEEALARSERRYRNIFENVQEVYFETDGRGRILEVSPALERVSFYTRAEVLELGVLPLLAGSEGRERLFGLLDRQGHVSDLPMEFLDKDGTQRHFSINAQLIADERGDLKVVGTLHDVTLRMAAEAELQGAREFLRAIIDAMPDPVYVKDAALRYVLVNHAMCTLTGRSREEMLGSTAEQVYEPEQGRRFGETDARALAGDCPVIEEEDYWDPSGVWRLLASNKAVFTDRDGQRFLVAAIRDVTGARRMQEEFRRAKERAEYLAESKGAFLANMSHEIRTPLNGVIGMLQLMNLTELNREQSEYARTAQSSAQGLLAVINDILDFSKIESGNMDTSCSRFSLHAVLETVQRSLFEQARSKGVGLDFHLGDVVPEWVEAPEARLRQVLFNLVGNAVKFTDQGEVQVEVHAFDRMPASGGPAPGKLQLYFEVRDTGIGIADQDLQTVFEPFVQAEGSRSRRYQGTGLGLGIVRRLVALLGGSLCVVSQEGMGTTVCFTAFVRAVAGPVEPEMSASPVVAEAVGRSGLRVLVAEDNRVNRVLAERFLHKLGHLPTSVENGRQALEALSRAQQQGEPFNLVLMDIQMPEMDGIEAVRCIREGWGNVPGDVPVVALTAHAMEGDMERFLELGMDGYLAKPLDFTIFADLLRELFPAGDDSEQGAPQTA
jgi:PAS domain S-box-containing protein